MKPIRTVVIVAFVGLGAMVGYEYKEITRHDREIADARAAIPRRQRLLAEIERRTGNTQHDIEQLKSDLAAADASAGSDQRFGSHSAEIRTRLARMHELRALMNRKPEHQIPELQLLSEAEWLRLAQEGHWDTESAQRERLAAVRTAAKSDFCHELSLALEKFSVNNDGKLPSDLTQLTTFFEGTIPPGALERYRLLPTSAATQRRSQDVIVEASAVDPDYDARMTVGPHGSAGWSSPWLMTDLRDDVEQAAQQLRKAQPQNQSAEPANLLPYLQTPLGRAWVSAEAAYHQATGKNNPLPDQLLPYLTDPTARHYAEVLDARRRVQQ